MDSKCCENRAAAEGDADSAGCVPEPVASLEERFLRFQSEMRAEFSAVRHEMHRLAETLRVEIRAGDAETRRYMRVLHEEVLSRIANIQRR